MGFGVAIHLQHVRLQSGDLLRRGVLGRLAQLALLGDRFALLLGRQVRNFFSSGLGLLLLGRRHHHALSVRSLRHGADVEPRGLSEVARLAAVVAGHRDDQVVTTDHDFRPCDAEAVDALGDDLLGLVELVARGSLTVGRPRGQRDAGTTLQVDAELGLWVAVAGEEHQAEDDGEQG